MAANSECHGTSKDGSRPLAGIPEHQDVRNIAVQSSDPRSVRHTCTPTRCTTADASRSSHDDGNSLTVITSAGEGIGCNKRLADVPRSSRDNGNSRTVLTYAGEEIGRNKRLPSLPPQDASAIFDSKLCPSLHHLTVRALAAASRVDAEYAKTNRVYRKGFSTNESIPLEQRAAMKKWHPKHGSPDPTSTVEDGDAFRFISDAFLEILHALKLVDRIDCVRASGNVPRAACDTTKFHRVYWKAFQRICVQPFGELTQEQQTTALKMFLRQKFSTDPHGRTMVPPKGRRRKRLSWVGFWLTEEEISYISESVMAGYYIQRNHAAYRTRRECGQNGWQRSFRR